MSSPDQSPVQTAVPSTLAELRRQLRPLILSIVVLTLLTGALFPAVLGALSFLFFRHQADGTLLERDHAIVGSALIGQDFNGPGMFHSRPSAAGDAGYVGTASGGSNRGPANKDLLQDIRNRTEKYRNDNHLAPETPVPIDAVTASGSGLDPHISPENAALQIPRVAQERGLPEDQVRALVAEYTEGRQFGFLGQPRVNVLLLNLALQSKAPRTSASQTP